MKRLKYKILTTVFVFSMFVLRNLFAVGFSVGDGQIGPFNDNSTNDITLGSDFTSGSTISSAEMNSKFKQIQQLLNDLIKLNNLSISSKYVVFATSTTYSGQLGGRTGADEKCNNDSIRASLNNIKTCNSVKALIETSDVTFKNQLDYDSVIYGPKGDILANSWSEFSELRLLNPELLGGYSGMSDSIWTGSGAGSSMSCDDWTSYSSAKTGRTFGTNNTTYAFPVWNAGSNHCGYYHAILCICK